VLRLMFYLHQDEDFGGFTQLRHDDAETLLAPQVDMPDPSISATARRRNEALLEGEMELDTDAVEAEPVLIKQYINQNGSVRAFSRFFVQHTHQSANLQPPHANSSIWSSTIDKGGYIY
jgi:hypothetical protein